MFLHLCVILFTRGVSVQGGLCPGGLYPGMVSVQGVSVQRGVGISVEGEALCPRRSLSRGSISGGSLSKGGLCPRRSLSRGSISGGSLSQGGLCPGGFSVPAW